MPSFVDIVTGALAKASDVQQIIDALKGTAGKGIPLSLTSVNDAINFALSVKNNDATASKTAVFYKADGTVLLQVDKNGVSASPDGVAGASQIVTLTSTQTLTNKTVALQTVSNVLAADVALNNTATYFDGPSMAQGAAGTWFVTGTVTVTDTAVATFRAKLWDGTTVIASAVSTMSTAGGAMSITLSGVLATPAANIRISVEDISTVNGAIKANSSANAKDSAIWGVRIG